VILDRMNSNASGAVPPSTPLPDGFVPPRSISSYLKKGSQVQVRPFLNPFLSSDHSKVFITDSRRVWLGGMNLGREYRYEWHDLMVEVEGPVVASFERQFSMNWSHAGALGDLAYAGNGLFGKPVPPAGPVPDACVDLRRLSTKTGRPTICKAELESIRRSRNYIYLENPYLFDNRVLVGLVRARLRGVDVRVVLPNFNDLKAGHRSNLVTANYLLNHGVRVYLYPGMTHIKALLVDGWACLGSANFNNLSLRLNQEHDLATSDPQFAARLKRELFETDFAKSHELTEPIAVTWTDHLVDSVFNQF
jgi:cardiolipin synthase